MVEMEMWTDELESLGSSSLCSGKAEGWLMVGWGYTDFNVYLVWKAWRYQSSFGSILDAVEVLDPC